MESHYDAARFGKQYDSINAVLAKASSALTHSQIADAVPAKIAGKSTVAKRLKEMTGAGLLIEDKDGRASLFSLTDGIDQTIARVKRTFAGTEGTVSQSKAVPAAAILSPSTVSDICAQLLDHVEALRARKAERLAEIAEIDAALERVAA